MIRQGDFCVGNNFEKDLKIPKERGAITILVGGENESESGNGYREECGESEADYVINNIYELEN